MSEPNHGEPNQRESPIDSQLAAPPVSYHAAPVTPAPRSQSTAGELLQSRITVLAVLFLVTGALGIPLLWINRNFTTRERILWTIVVSIYTVALLALTAWILWWAYSRIAG